MWKIDKITHFSSPLPFLQVVAGIEVSQREGALLTLTNDLGNTRVIEIAPFPGFSKFGIEESISEFKTSLQSFSKLKSETIQHSNPHVEFALFSLTLEMAQEDKEDKRSKTIPSNKLMPLDEFIKAQIEHEIDFAYTYKIKAPNFKHAFNEFSKIQLPLPMLRIDPNSNWNSEQLENFWSLLKRNGHDKKVDYFEEPLIKFEDYKLLNKDIPYCHDELIDNFLLTPTNALGIVYKPSQQGISKLNKLRKMRKRIILSSTFDGPYALRVIKYLAKDLSSEIHGLGATIQYE